MSPATKNKSISRLTFSIMLLVLSGCQTVRHQNPEFNSGHELNTPAPQQYQPESHPVANFDNGLSPAAQAQPLTSRSELPTTFVELSLDEAIAIALQNTDILRSLSATVVQNTQGANSTLDPAIQSTDPVFGIEAALSAFDTNLSSSILYSNNDDTFNNPSTTGAAATVQQDLTDFRFGLNKVTARGTQLSIDSNITHDNSTNPALLFPSAFNTSWEASVRHPLLQGNGTLFNRTVGPLTTPNFNGTSGFLISRSNHDISIAEFERNVRQMILEIVNAYWQLDLAMDNFLSIKASRDASQETWNVAKARMDNGLSGGEADREAIARAQFYLFESQLRDSLSTALQNEADLRRLLGMRQSDGAMLKPTDSASGAASVFDWTAIASNALGNRVEMRQQGKRIEQRELFLLAARNFTLPRFDAIATYRNNGFGDNLLANGGQFAGALNEAFAGNFDEWEFGLTLDVPLGFRQAFSGVRNAELQLMRERAILEELKSQILHDLGSAVRGFDQSQDALELSRLRATASAEAVQARNAAYKADAVSFQDLLDAQRGLLDAELAFQDAKASYELALAQVYFESGHLLREYAISFSKETTPDSEHRQAIKSEYLNNAVQGKPLHQDGFLY